MLKMRDERNSFMNSVILYRGICFDDVCLEASIRRPNWGGLGFSKVEYHQLPRPSGKGQSRMTATLSCPSNHLQSLIRAFEFGYTGKCCA